MMAIKHMNHPPTEASSSLGFSSLNFSSLNNGYNRVFKMNKLSIGLVVPIENYDQIPAPTLQDHLVRVQLAEKLGFSAVWLRDVPFNVPSFGDAGQLFDPFTYLGYLAGQTHSIALGVSSIVLPLRHPAHVAKAAASVDVLSEGRLIMGVASGDRAEEYPAMNLTYDDRGKRFRDSFDYIRGMQCQNPELSNRYGQLKGDLDMLPKPTAKLPLLITGSSQQSPEWIAENGDGWMLYPREINAQQKIVQEWRYRVEEAGRSPQPVMQPLYIDLQADDQTKAQALHLGFRSNAVYLVDYLKTLEAIGVNHVALNLRFNQADIETTLNQLAEQVLPAFSGNRKMNRSKQLSN